MDKKRTCIVALATLLPALGAPAFAADAPKRGDIGTLEERSAQGAVEVFCRSLPAAIDFYTKVGFIVERRAPTFIALKRDSLYLFLNERAKALQGDRGIQLRIITPDVDALAAKFKADAIHFEMELSDRYYGLREFSVIDPCGFVLRFAKPI